MSQPEPSPTFLELSENQPTTVYVHHFPKTETAPEQVGFAETQGGTYHTLGIKWFSIPPSSKAVDHGNAKFLSLMLEPPVVGIKCDLHYSPRVDAAPTPGCLMLCIPTGQFQAEYHFTVTVPSGQLGVRVLTDIDPKIIVTPVNPSL